MKDNASTLASRGRRGLLRSGYNPIPVSLKLEAWPGQDMYVLYRHHRGLPRLPALYGHANSVIQKFQYVYLMSE